MSVQNRHGAGCWKNIFVSGLRCTYLLPFILSLLLTCFSASVWADNSKADSLENVLSSLEGDERYPVLMQLFKEVGKQESDHVVELTREALEMALRIGEDEEVIDLRVARSRQNFIRGKVEEAFQTIEPAIELARVSNQPNLVAKTLLLKSKLYHNTNRYQESLELLNEAVVLVKDSEEHKLLAGTIYRNIGSNHFRMYEYEKAEANFNKALESYSEQDYNKLYAVRRSLGMMEMRRSNYDLAVGHFLDALKQAESMGRMDKKGITLGDLGEIYYTMGEHDKALEVLLEGKALLENSSDLIQRVSILTRLGEAYQMKEQYDLALETYLEAKEMVGRTGNRFLIARVSIAVAYISNKQKKFDQARENFKLAIRQAEEINAVTLMGMAEIYLGQMEYELGNYQEAVIHLERGKEHGGVIENDNYNRSIYLYLSKSYFELGEYKEAYLAHEMFKQAADSLNKTERMERLDELIKKYETEKTEKELLLQQKENDLLTAQNQQAELRNVIYGIALTVLVLLALFIIQRQRQKIRHSKTQRSLMKAELENTRLESERKEWELKQRISVSEQKALRAQMNPHFIFNCLNSIQLLIVENQRQLAMKNIGRFSRLMRKILENSRKQRVSLEEELETLQLYLEMEKVRLKDKLEFDIQVENEMHPSLIYVPPMLIQPLVENAIWHGIMHKEGSEGKIEIFTSTSGKFLKFSVKDNGIGREKRAVMKETEVPREGTSAGISIVEERLQILNEEEEAQEIRIIDLKTEAGIALGTQTELLIPLMQR